jgi:hypothetical protein
MLRSVALVVLVAGMAKAQSSLSRDGEPVGVTAVNAIVEVRDLEGSGVDGLASGPPAQEVAAVAPEQHDRQGDAESLHPSAAAPRVNLLPPSEPVRLGAPPTANLARPEVEPAPQSVQLVERRGSGIRRFSFGLLSGLGGAVLGGVIGLGAGALAGVGFGGLSLGPVAPLLTAGAVAGSLLGGTCGASIAATAMANSLTDWKVSAGPAVVGSIIGVALGMASAVGINFALQLSSPGPLTPGLVTLLALPILFLTTLGSAVGAQLAVSERITAADDERLGFGKF